jgi:alkanesulfonate monooxygenase SsuD/methylene tetrahydromethanopterin reductase-like flavin-dependent oxidoreductase (luciferase family)
VPCNSFRNPAIMTKMATTMHEMSHGRLILDTGAGWNQPEYQAFGLDRLRSLRLCFWSQQTIETPQNETI